jgi:hypothetical protein
MPGTPGGHGRSALTCILAGARTQVRLLRSLGRRPSSIADVPDRGWCVLVARQRSLPCFCWSACWADSVRGCPHYSAAGSPRARTYRTASGPKERSAEPLALPIRARFVTLRGRPDCSPDGCIPAGSAPFCSRWAAGWSCSCPRPGRVAGSARAIPSMLHREGDRVRRPLSGGPGCHGERHCARAWTLHERRHHVAAVPVSSLRD